MFFLLHVIRIYMNTENKVALIIMDGLGLGDAGPGDAVAHAERPFLNHLFATQSYSKLHTHGGCVGLPEFQTGGSEVGHITIGAGRAIKHLLTRINDLIDSGEFFENETLKALFEDAKTRGRIHFMGLCSDGGIHSFLPHLFGLLQMAKQYDIPQVYIHFLADGRDVGERTAAQYLAQIAAQGVGQIATLGGRYYGMDRDKNWDRIEKHYRALTDASMEVTPSTPEEYIRQYYDTTDTSDYYIPPAVFMREGQLRPDDTLIFFDYRTDRARQISAALYDESFAEFDRPVKLDAGAYGVFGDYYDTAQKPFSFGKHSAVDTLGQLVSDAGDTQLRISETEKFNHVTFFFSGERKEEFPGEERILIPSPKCKSYAEKPEMSAYTQCDALLERLNEKDYTLIVQNYANADLVGHSGSYDAAKRSVEVVDECLKKSVPVLLEKGYDVLITADHGNSDEMIKDGDTSASHSKNVVPCFVLRANGEKVSMRELGTLQDIAPTLLNLLGKEIPSVMEGKNLLQ